MWIVGVDCKRESECATLVHAFKEISLTNNVAQKKKKIPSSGVIVSVKLRRSAGSAK